MRSDSGRMNNDDNPNIATSANGAATARRAKLVTIGAVFSISSWVGRGFARPPVFVGFLPFRGRGAEGRLKVELQLAFNRRELQVSPPAAVPVDRRRGPR